MIRKTPVTDEGLHQYDNLDVKEAIFKAWTDPGRFPSWHYRMQQIVRKHMPVLGRALDRLADEYCPVCMGGNSRHTTGLVCQTCGRDYGDPTID